MYTNCSDIHVSPTSGITTNNAFVIFFPLGNPFWRFWQLILHRTIIHPKLQCLGGALLRPCSSFLAVAVDDDSSASAAAYYDAQLVNIASRGRLRVVWYELRKRGMMIMNRPHRMRNIKTDIEQQQQVLKYLKTAIETWVFQLQISTCL